VSRALLAALATCVLALAGCDADDAFHCLEDAQCGPAGVCEVNGSCSFEDDACDSGRRFGEFSPEGIAHVCVPPEDPADAEEPDVEPDVEPLSNEGPVSVCGQENSCDACMDCAVAEQGPCAADLGACGSNAECFLGMTCTSVCVDAGVCGNCCADLSPGAVDIVTVATECIVAECAQVCGQALLPTCTPS